MDGRQHNFQHKISNICKPVNDGRLSPVVMVLAFHMLSV